MKTSMDKRHFFKTAIALGAMACGAVRAADPYPARTVRMVVPYAAGGSVDILGRVLAQRLAESLGQPVVVDNRGGGGTTIGTAAVAQAQPDGYTVLLTDLAFAANPSLMANLPFNSATDFAPVIKVADLPAVFVVPEDSPAKTLKEFVELAKKKPGDLNYASSGIGSLNFLATELFKSRTGVFLTHIPYQSGAQAVTSLLGKQTQVLITTVPPALAHIKSGKLRALAVASSKRIAALPDTPTFAEAGVPDFEVALWQGVFVPARTPEAVVDKLNASINKLLETDELKERIAALGGNPYGGTAQQFASFVRADTARWRGLIKPEMLQNK